MGTGLPDPRRHSNDQQLPEILVTHFGDPTKLLLASAGLVSWRQTKPGSKLPTVPELMAVANTGDDS